MIYWICHLVCDANVGTLRLMSGEIVGILERRSVDIFCVQVSRYMGSVLNSVGIVPSWDSWVPCHLAIFPSWVQMGIIFFLQVILWVWNFFSWVLYGSKSFSVGYIVDPNYFLVGTSWVQNFFLQVYVGPKFFLVSISLASSILKSRIVSAIFLRRFSFISSSVHQEFE